MFIDVHSRLIPENFLTLEIPSMSVNGGLFLIARVGKVALSGLQREKKIYKSIHMSDVEGEQNLQINTIVKEQYLRQD